MPCDAGDTVGGGVDVGVGVAVPVVDRLMVTVIIRLLSRRGTCKGPSHGRLKHFMETLDK